MSRRGIRQRLNRNLRRAIEPTTGPAATGNKCIKTPDVVSGSQGERWAHYLLNGQTRTLRPDPSTFRAIFSSLQRILGNIGCTSINGHSISTHPNSPLPLGPTNVHLNAKGNGGTGNTVRAPEANPCVVFRFLAWRDNVSPIGFTRQRSIIKSVRPGGTFARQIEDEQKHFLGSRFPQVGDCLLGISYGNNRTLTGATGETLIDLSHEPLCDGPVVLWYAHQDTMQHIVEHRVKPTIISTTNSTYRRTFTGIPPGTTLVQLLGASVITTGSRPAIQFGDYPPGIIKNIEAGEATSNRSRPLTDNDIITSFAEGNGQGTHYDAIHKLQPGYVIPEDIDTISFMYHCGDHERDIKESGDNCTPQPHWERLWTPLPGKKDSTAKGWTPPVRPPLPREPPLGQDWLARIMFNASEVLPPCCFPKGQGEATITVGSLNFLSRAESASWTNDGNCEAITDTARRNSAALKAIIGIDADVILALGLDNMFWDPALSKEKVMGDLRRNFHAILYHAAHGDNCQPCVLIRKGAGIAPIRDSTRGDKSWSAVSIDFNRDRLTCVSIHWPTTPSDIVLDARRMAIRQAMGTKDKVIVAGTFSSCSADDASDKLIEMVEIVRTLSKALRLIRPHDAQQGSSIAPGNSEDSPTDFMFLTRDFQANRHITFGKNFHDECNDNCQHMNNKLKRPTPTIQSQPPSLGRPTSLWIHPFQSNHLTILHYGRISQRLLPATFWSYPELWTATTPTITANTFGSLCSRQPNTTQMLAYKSDCDSNATFHLLHTESHFTTRPSPTWTTRAASAALPAARRYGLIGLQPTAIFYWSMARTMSTNSSPTQATMGMTSCSEKDGLSPSQTETKTAWAQSFPTPCQENSSSPWPLPNVQDGL